MNTEIVYGRDNLKSGLLYFYIHFVTEAICFYVLTGYVGNRPEIWLLFLSYDLLAFVPQGIIGYICDRHPKMAAGAIGLVLLVAAILLFEHADDPYISLVVLCMGNCLIHINGAEITLRTAGGRLTGSAVFVSGGSFGVITGKLLSSAGAPAILLIILALTAIPPVLFAQRYIGNNETAYRKQCMDFRYARTELSGGLIILMAVTIVAVRGFMGYGIPSSWNKTVIQTVMLYSFMGTGKALGGIFADRIGFRKTALISTIMAAPFLMFGDDLMIVSLIGVMLFSMTMAITLGILVSVMPENPGLAFGWTTIGLFIGSVPIFFCKLITLKANCIMIAALSILCFVLMLIIIREDKEHE